jgi:hypothetical protein
MVGLPFLSLSNICFCPAKELYATDPSTKISSGIIMTIKYIAAVVSLQRTSQCGFTFIVTGDHWQDQLFSV